MLKDPEQVLEPHRLAWVQRASNGFDVGQHRAVREFTPRTHLRQLFTAAAMHVVRVIAWLWGEPLGERRRKSGNFAQLAPHPLSRQAVRC